MKFNKVENKAIGETLYFGTHESGLGIFVVPKKNFSKKYAIIGAKIGSVDNTFIPNGENEQITVPDGIAHFLEHKMFEMSDGSDAFAKFSEYGANANAFTSFTNTCYLFSCTDNFYESFEHLLNYVKSPYFTDANVEKEKGIIGQEIKMYDDDGEWRVMFNLLRALYKDLPVRIDIAGTAESISHITPDTLYKCYNTFYDPSNMILCVAGDVDENKVLEITDKIMGDKITGTKARGIYPDEQENVFQKEIEQKLSVSSPIFDIGFKDSGKYTGDEILKNEIAVKIILSSVASKSSDLYERLYNDGLINDEFSYDYMYEEQYACAIIGGESKEPKKVCGEVIKYLKDKKRIDADEFDRAKKSIWGSYLRTFNDVEGICSAMVRNVLKGVNWFDFSNIFDSVTLAFVNEKYEKLFCDEEKQALSVVYPA
ncbi:EF-P 5-aminopentanol modification-associated protein YfmH [Qingrenia yutianensis]|uniref:Insulinase family protein n=1 Tax=Qingrenia yutianensis TaxID=2763676 RepID=A0A926IMN7_9FIRM|nr:pitrilysin family protein [Qingrenia yutianensis]MBC8596247.1 insulinase family protein [Qingrenia yutianensis]